MQSRHMLLGLVLLIPVFAGCVEDPETVGTKVDAKTRKGLVPASLEDGGRFFAVHTDGTIPSLDVLESLEPLIGEQRFIGANTFEPTIGIDDKGVLYMVQFGGGSHIVASKDQGVTWSRVNPALVPVSNPANNQPVNNPPNSNDPFVWVDRETGRIFMNDLQALVCSWMNWSDDDGVTWTTNPIGCGHPFGVHDHQSITTGKARNLPSQWEGRNVYYCINRVGDTSCSVSLNGGLTFGPQITILPGVDVETGRLCGGLAGHAKTDNEGRVFLGKNQCGIPTIAVSEDDGVNWETYPVSREIGIRGHDVEIATDEANNVYAFWLSDRGLPTLAVSKNSGKTWGPSFTVGAPGVTVAKFNAIDAEGVGKVAFTYMGSNVVGGPTAVAENYTGTMWHAYIGVITDALAENPLVQTTMVDSAADPVAINRCLDRCDGMGDFMDIQIDPFGRPWAALVDVCGEKCVANFQTDPETALHDGNKGFVGTLTSGPALVTEGGALLPLPPLVAAPVEG